MSAASGAVQGVIAAALMTVITLLVAGCYSNVNRLPPAGETAAAQWRWFDPSVNYDLLATLALESAGSDLHRRLPTDVTAYCSAYPRLSMDQRRRFWRDLLAAIAWHESGHDTDLTYRERFTDNSGQRVVSRGLLQLSIESSRAYDCPLDEAEQLHDPARNIDCAVRILDKWVGQDGVISRDGGGQPRQWLGGARYWSVLRRSTTRAAIQALMQQRPYCGI